MRDRSGRSGRRLGSQKPGTAWGAASCFAGAGAATGPDPGALAGPCAAAGAARKANEARPRASKPPTDRPATRFRAESKDLWMGNEADCTDLAGDVLMWRGLIDHPARRMRAGLAPAGPVSPLRDIVSGRWPLPRVSGSH